MLNFCLIGCGRIAAKYMEIFSAGTVEGRISCVCDINPAKAERAGKQMNVPHFTDMHDMMRTMGDAVDVICVLTESGNHAAHVMQMAPYGKAIVVEKPMALWLDDADDMIRACDDHGIKLFVVKQNRYNLPVQAARQALEQGRFGKMVMGTVRVRWCRPQAYYDESPWRGTWSLDGGVFANQASHHIDLLEWFLGEPVSVFAKARTALVNIEAEDTGVAMVTFASGAIGVIEATTAMRPKDTEGSLSLIGEKGFVEIGGFAVNEMKHWQFVEPRPEDPEILQQCSENPPNVYGFGHVRYLQNVIDSLDRGTASLVDGLVGRRSLELINAIYESIETGREVPLRFRPKRSRLGAHSEPVA